MTEGGRKKGTTNTRCQGRRAGRARGGGGGLATRPRLPPKGDAQPPARVRGYRARELERPQTSHRGSGETRGPEITSEMAGGREASRRADVCLQRWQRTGSRPKADTTANFALPSGALPPLLQGHRRRADWPERWGRVALLARPASLASRALSGDLQPASLEPHKRLLSRGAPVAAGGATNRSHCRCLASFVLRLGKQGHRVCFIFIKDVIRHKMGSSPQ